jgi:DNA polymerase III alpha subunit
MACGFHSHSHFSLDGGSSVKKLVARAKELGRTAMNLTDHGNMNGLADLHLMCGKTGIKAIHGIELYIINNVNGLDYLVTKDIAGGYQVYKSVTFHSSSSSSLHNSGNKGFISSPDTLGQ